MNRGAIEASSSLLMGVLHFYDLPMRESTKAESTENLAEQGLPSVYKTAVHQRCRATDISWCFHLETQNSTQEMVTIFEYALERRMKHALELLRCKHEPVGQVAYAVGYRHQTSFASAFHEYFGFLPVGPRTDMN